MNSIKNCCVNIHQGQIDHEMKWKQSTVPTIKEHHAEWIVHQMNKPKKSNINHKPSTTKVTINMQSKWNPDERHPKSNNEVVGSETSYNHINQTNTSNTQTLTNPHGLLLSNSSWWDRNMMIVEDMWFIKLDANDNDNRNTTFQQLSAQITIMTAISVYWLSGKSKKQQPTTNQSPHKSIFLPSRQSMNPSHSFHNTFWSWRTYPTTKQTS